MRDILYPTSYRANIMPEEQIISLHTHHQAVNAPIYPSHPDSTSYLMLICPNNHLDLINKVSFSVPISSLVSRILQPLI